MAFKKGHLIKSNYSEANGINNWPGYDVGENPILTEDYIFENLNKLHKNILKPLGEFFGYTKLLITSGYRGIALNSAIGGSSTSHHVHGMAADIVALEHPSHVIFNWCVDNLPNDWAQLIWEYPEKGQYSNANKNCSWVHVAWKEGHNIKKTTLASKANRAHSYYESIPGVTRKDFGGGNKSVYSQNIMRAYHTEIFGNDINIDVPTINYDSL